MAPEQSAGVATAASDVYALCKVAIETFGASSPQDRLVPARLRSSLVAGLHENPNERPSVTQLCAHWRSIHRRPQRIRQVAWLASLAVALAGGTWAMAAPRDRCSDPGPLRQRWDDEQSALAEHFTQHADYGVSLWKTVAGEIDTAVAGVEKQLQALCRAPTPGAQRQLVCLEARARSTEALLDILQRPDAIEGAAQLVRALPPASTCIEAHATAPRDDAVLLELDLLRRSNDREHAEQKALEHIKALVRSGDFGTLARATTQHALMAAEAGDLDEAIVRCARAVQYAQRAGDPYALVEAYTQQAWIRGYLRGDHERGQEALASARAWLSRIDAPLLVWDLERTSGWIELGQGESRSSSAAFERAALALPAHGFDLERALAAADTGAAHSARGESQASADALGRALEALEHALGSSHPKTAAIRGQWASAAYLIGQRLAAKTAFDRAIGDLERTAPRSYALITLLNNFAGLMAAEGQVDRAIALIERAFELAKQSLGENHTTTLRISAARGSVFADAGRLSEAINALEPLVTTDDSAWLIPPLANLGRAYTQQGRRKEALQTLTRASDLVERYGIVGEQQRFVAEALEQARKK